MADNGHKRKDKVKEKTDYNGINEKKVVGRKFYIPDIVIRRNGIIYY